MRYIGSKDNLLGFIEQTVSEQHIHQGTFCDLFAGTTVVGRTFKRLGFRVISNDLMTYSFVFGKAYLENNQQPVFARLSLPHSPHPPHLFSDSPEYPADTSHLKQALTALNALPPEPGFIFDNYSDEGTRGKEHQRMFFSAKNAAKIDAIRNGIQHWHECKEITQAEFYILVASLLEAIPGVSNTSGTYAAFLKFWEARSQKTLTLTEPPLIISSDPLAPHLQHQVYQEDAGRLMRIHERVN